MSKNQTAALESINTDALWIYFYRALPVLVVVLLMLGIIK